MTAETKGKVQIISRYKDVEILDILQRNKGNSFMINCAEDLKCAKKHFGVNARVWIHSILISNADNEIRFRIAESLCFEIQGSPISN